ncbi:unnamed protein product [Amoebophrya sp. A25]|nr:unnamed protein product [Amoebophrya sp. A25]|eukprot:GSA25T00002404001.1
MGNFAENYRHKIASHLPGGLSTTTIDGLLTGASLIWNQFEEYVRGFLDGQGPVESELYYYWWDQLQLVISVEGYIDYPKPGRMPPVSLAEVGEAWAPAMATLVRRERRRLGSFYQPGDWQMWWLSLRFRSDDDGAARRRGTLLMMVLVTKIPKIEDVYSGVVV